MRRRPTLMASSLLPRPLALLPLLLAAATVVAPCRSFLVIGRWRGHGAPFAARPHVARRTSSVAAAPTTPERCINWLEDLGLDDTHVQKAVGKHPALLKYSVEAMKATVQWFKDLGMDEAQLKKAIVRYPQLLGYSLESNLKPTAQWLNDLGMEESQVKKAIVAFPQLLAQSIENNLKPTVQWFKDLGMDDPQLHKAIAQFPHLLKYSVENNLKPKVQMLRDWGFADSQIVQVLSSFPQLLSYSAKRLAHRGSVLAARGPLQDQSLNSVMTLTDAKFAARFE